MKQPDITHFTMVAKSFGFSVQENGYDEFHKEWDIELNQYTPAGEDWVFGLSFKEPNELVKVVEDYWNDFDVDEDVVMWIEGRGTRGIPSSIQTLLDNANWKRDQLFKLYKALDECPLEENQANRLIHAIKSKRFNHERYFQKRLWNYIPIQTERLHSSYGTIGFTLSVYDKDFLQYDWELNEITLI